MYMWLLHVHVASYLTDDKQLTQSMCQEYMYKVIKRYMYIACISAPLCQQFKINTPTCDIVKSTKQHY